VEHHQHFKEAEECWQCGTPSEKSLFCKFCSSLQKPRLDYYRFFGIDRKLRLDPEDLEKRFYNLSRLLHPDRYTRKTNREQDYSLEATAILNDAYRTLRDPVARAEYVLKQNSFENVEPRSNSADPELLEEVFELNMALEGMRDGDDSARPQLEVAQDKFTAMRSEMDRDLQDLFEEYDATADAGSLSRIRKLLDRRKYIQNLVSEVEHELGN
jgi:molecular chaperone HscB